MQWEKLTFGTSKCVEFFSYCSVCTLHDDVLSEEEVS